MPLNKLESNNAVLRKIFTRWPNIIVKPKGHIKSIRVCAWKTRGNFNDCVRVDQVDCVVYLFDDSILQLLREWRRLLSAPSWLDHKFNGDGSSWLIAWLNWTVATDVIKIAHLVPTSSSTPQPLHSQFQVQLSAKLNSCQSKDVIELIIRQM